MRLARHQPRLLTKTPALPAAQPHSTPADAQRMSAGDYSTTTGFAVDLALKDVGHMKALAAASACPLPLADLVRPAAGRAGPGLGRGELRVTTRCSAAGAWLLLVHS